MTKIHRHNKISRQGGSTFEEGSLEEGRISSSLAEAIFDHSGVKDISRRDIEVFLMMGGLYAHLNFIGI